MTKGCRSRFCQAQAGRSACRRPPPARPASMRPAFSAASSGSESSSEISTWSSGWRSRSRRSADGKRSGLPRWRSCPVRIRPDTLPDGRARNASRRQRDVAGRPRPLQGRKAAGLDRGAPSGRTAAGRTRLRAAWTLEADSRSGLQPTWLGGGGEAAAVRRSTPGSTGKARFMRFSHLYVRQHIYFLILEGRLAVGAKGPARPMRTHDFRSDTVTLPTPRDDASVERCTSGRCRPWRRSPR